MQRWQIRWARSATRHRISRRRSGYVVRTTSVIFREPRQGSPLGDDRIVFLGADEEGAMLEVMAIETDAGGLLVIHAMPIRARYLGLLTGGL